MSMDRLDQVPDPLLAGAFEELRQDAPSNVDWEGMHRSIHDRAELVFARRKHQRTRHTRRQFMPVALAASIALALWSGPALIERITADRAGVEVAAGIDSEAILREALGGDLTDQEFDLLVTGRAYPEALLAVAIESP